MTCLMLSVVIKRKVSVGGGGHSYHPFIGVFLIEGNIIFHVRFNNIVSYHISLYFSNTRIIFMEG